MNSIRVFDTDIRPLSYSAYDCRNCNPQNKSEISSSFSRVLTGSKMRELFTQSISVSERSSVQKSA